MCCLKHFFYFSNIQSRPTVKTSMELFGISWTRTPMGSCTGPCGRQTYNCYRHNVSNGSSRICPLMLGTGWWMVDWNCGYEQGRHLFFFHKIKVKLQSSWSYLWRCIQRTGNALAWMQLVHEPRAFQDAPAPADPNS